MRLYDTSTRTVRDFVPLVEGTVSIYLCGATVQAPPHIGHIRSGLNFDLLRRWLAYRGNDVVFCRNVTDIDDKIIAKACEADVPWWRVGYPNERAFNDAYAALGCLPPTVEPRATGHVPEMIELMQRLITTGHAYPSDGDVYFDVHSYPEYGALSGQRLDAMRDQGDAGVGAKRDARDFALWKAAKPGEPSWDTPWGAAGPAGTWSAPRWPTATSASASTSTAAASTWCSRTTRTRSRSPRRRATVSPTTGCTTRGSP